MTAVPKYVIGAVALAISPVAAVALDCRPEAFGTATVRDVHQCISAGADLEARGDEHATPLHFAAAKGNTPAIRVPIAAGANLEARNMVGLTPLHTAAIFDMTATVQALLEVGADTEARTHAGATPLHWAVVYGEGVDGRYIVAPTILALVEGGADINARDKSGATPLMWALRTGNEVAMYMIAKAGGE